jgi:hypothetical protein
MAVKKISGWQPLALITVLAWLIMAPLLRPGFVFALDMAPTPVWRLPHSVTSSYPFYALMHTLNIVVPGDILQKLLLIVIFLLAGLGMYYLYQKIEATTPEAGSLYGAYFAAIFYVINPYTYSRFMAGQFAVLLGYALIPWFTRSLLRMAEAPDGRKAIGTGLWAAAIGIVSIHSLGLAAIVTITSLCLAAWRHRDNKPVLKKLSGATALLGVVFVVLSCYWLVPLIMGSGSTSAAIRGFGAGDQQAFATLGDSAVSRLAHITHLQGFWAEQYGLYHPSQTIKPLWWLGWLLLFCLIIAGFIRYLRKGKRAEVVLLTVVASIAALLAAGIFVTWLSNYLAVFAGYREPHKFTGLVVLAYAILAGSGVTWLQQWAKQRSSSLTSPLPALTLVVPFLLALNMLVGGGHQLSSRQYPESWYRANAILNQDQSQSKVLFLPWHLYMHFGFAAALMVNPADNFFDKPTLISNNPEIGHSSPNNPDPQKAKINSLLPQIKQGTDISPQLASMGIKYIILANEADAGSYRRINTHQLKLVYSDPGIKLYKNTAWKEQ